MYQLYSDANTFHREYPANYRLGQIMAEEGIKGRARLGDIYGDTKEYRVDGSGFQFSIRVVA